MCMMRVALHANVRGQHGGWSRCGTCKEVFTGAMQHELARAWWAWVVASDDGGGGGGDSGDSDDSGDGNELAHATELLLATGNLALSYSDGGQHADAAGLQEQALALQIKVCGGEHPHALEAAHNLAVTYVPPRHGTGVHPSGSSLGLGHARMFATPCNLSQTLQRTAPRRTRSQATRLLARSAGRPAQPTGRRCLDGVGCLATAHGRHRRRKHVLARAL